AAARDPVLHLGGDRPCALHLVHLRAPGLPGGRQCLDRPVGWLQLHPAVLGGPVPHGPRHRAAVLDAAPRARDRLCARQPGQAPAGEIRRLTPAPAGISSSRCPERRGGGVMKTMKMLLALLLAGASLAAWADDTPI